MANEYPSDVVPAADELPTGDEPGAGSVPGGGGAVVSDAQDRLARTEPPPAANQSKVEPHPASRAQAGSAEDGSAKDGAEDSGNAGGGQEPDDTRREAALTPVEATDALPGAVPGVTSPIPIAAGAAKAAAPPEQGGRVVAHVRRGGAPDGEVSPT